MVIIRVSKRGKLGVSQRKMVSSKEKEELFEFRQL
jgi:hypothetical protein